MKKLIKLSEAVKHAENPFIKDSKLLLEKNKLGYKLAGRVNKNVLYMDDDTGEEMEGTLFVSQQILKDKDRFVKLYMASFSVFFDLSKCGLKVLKYVFDNLPKDKDMIYLNNRRLKEATGYRTHAQIYKGIGELLASKILALSKDASWYYINPSVAFNGDRFTLIQDYRYKEHKKVEQKTIKF